jgi:CheY-like chemotaxis protein
MEGCKILIIDDDTDDVEILSDAFAQSGVESVHYVHSAMEAFMYLQQQKDGELPKLIVTDMYLPGITGAEFLKDLKKMERYGSIHVIVLSTIKTDVEIERYKQMGAVDYLQKPSSYDEYLQVAQGIKERVLGLQQ